MVWEGTVVVWGGVWGELIDFVTVLVEDTGPAVWVAEWIAVWSDGSNWVDGVAELGFFVEVSVGDLGGGNLRGVDWNISATAFQVVDQWVGSIVMTEGSIGVGNEMVVLGNSDLKNNHHLLFSIR